MLFTLLKDERIITGPRDWNPKYFEYFLQSECSIDTPLPDAAPGEPLIFDEHVKLVPTLEEVTPEIDPTYEQIYGPNFKYDEQGNYVCYYSAQYYPMDVIKTNLKNIVAGNRWIKETTSINRLVDPYQLTIYTDRGSRTAYTQALVFATDDYSAQWKFPQGFVVLNKTQLQTIVDEVVDYVQSCFDWESSVDTQIDNASTVEELKQIILE